MFETLRRLCDDAYRASDSGMSVGLPRVSVDASQLKHLLDHYDALAARCEKLEYDYGNAVETIQEIANRVRPLLPVALAGGEG